MEILGIDIGTSQFKAVSVNRGKRNRLTKFIVEPTGDLYNKILSESENDLLDVASQLKKFFKEHDISANAVVAVLPDDKIFTKVITMPYLQGKELASAIEWEAEQHLPQALSEVYLKYSQLKTFNVSKNTNKADILDKVKNVSGQQNPMDSEKVMEVLLVAAPKNIVKKYIFVLNKAGVEPLGIEPSAISTIRGITSYDISVPTMVVNFGYSKVSFYLAIDNVLRFTRTINMAIGSLIKVIKQELDLSETQSSEYLYTYGLRENELSGKLITLVSPVMNIIVDELKKSISYVETRPALIGETDVKKVRRVIISGGGALIPDVVIYFVKGVEAEVEIAKTWNSVDTSGFKDRNQLNYLGPLFSGALGAAIKEM